MGRRPTARDLLRDAQRASTGGKRANAPCGHPGEHVLAGYIRCLEGCDGEAVPVHVPPEKTKCLHRNTGAFHDPLTRRMARVCMDCKERLW